jgi:MYXO-CTERM domain-containing protein
MLASAPGDLDTIAVSDEQVLLGGTAVLAVAYFHGKDRVYGRGIASASTQAGLAVVPQTSPGSEATEWLELTPSVIGNYTLSVSSNGSRLADLAVTAVPASAVASLTLSAEQTELKDDAQIWVLAVAKDASQKVVDGVYCSWALGDVAQPDSNGTAGALGDLYRYTYESSLATQPLTASFGALTATQSYKVKQGTVTTTADLSCGSTGAGAAPLWLGLLALGLTVRRRRGTVRSYR